MKLAISTAAGLGDLIMNRGCLDTIKHKYEEIRISIHTPTLSFWRQDNNRYLGFVREFGKLIYSDKPYVFDNDLHPFKDQLMIINQYNINPQRANLANFLCQGDFKLDQPYVVFTTKVRLVKQSLLESGLPALWKALNSIPYPIVILGEQEVERSKEYSIRVNSDNIFGVYAGTKNLNNTIDLTVPKLGITVPDMKKLRYDCQVMRDAKAVITLGVGGNFCLSLACAKNTIGFRSDSEPHLDMLMRNKPEGVFLTRDWNQFLDKIKVI